MHLTLLAVADCPNVNLLEQRLAQDLKGRDVTVSRHVITDQDEAARRGMHGSPAILVDGIDPFAEPGLPVSVSCRLYRDKRGRGEGAPSVRQLRHAISDPVTIVADTDSGGWLDALGRGGRGRVAPAERGLRAVHQAVLRSFAATGRPPEHDVLDKAARPFGTSQVLAELAGGDYLCLGRDGRITAAYPFSATATPHTAQISGGAVAYSMCAIDALGVAGMVDASVLVRSADPSTGEPISVAVDGNGATWEPDTAVVFAGHTADTCEGPSAAVCCGHMNFFTSHSTAAAWAQSHPEITGGILSQSRALGVGQQIFGPLLH
ncbi:MAG: alkylmercury lyase family protein [Trebonia sp.]